MVCYQTSGDMLKISTDAFTRATKQLLLPYRKGSNVWFTLAYALHVYSHTQQPQITKLGRKEDVGSSLGTIVRVAYKTATCCWAKDKHGLLCVETNDFAILDAILLSRVNAVRNDVSRPILQGLFAKRVRNEYSDRIFILGPIWWKLVNAGTPFPAWANKYRP